MSVAELMHKVQCNSLTEVEPGEFVTEASDLQVPDKKWPRTLLVTDPNADRCFVARFFEFEIDERTKDEVKCAVYCEVRTSATTKRGYSFTVKVFND
jgi:hypothetical protein